LLTAAPATPTLAAIERQIVRRLAERAGRGHLELERELRLADRDLPVDADELTLILRTLEADFDVSLSGTAALRSRLDYVRELAMLIQAQRLASTLAAK
jgi:3-polyprenyl-4-hydroxybenzoate decarboxylase